MSAGVPYRFETPTLQEVDKPSKLPQGRCYVIQFYENYSVHHEGDERSRTNPGHGYPAYTEHITKIRQFVTSDEAEWREAIASLFAVDKGRSDVVAFVMERARIETKVSVNVLPA